MNAKTKKLQAIVTCILVYMNKLHAKSSHSYLHMTIDDHQTDNGHKTVKKLTMMTIKQNMQNTKHHRL